MTPSRTRFLNRLGPVLGLALLVGCAQTQPTRFYTLSSEAEPLIAASDLAITVGPVGLPSYLDRPQLVVRTTPNQVTLAEFDAWIEPLETMLPRILAADLATLLGTDRVVVLPQREPGRPDYRVEADFQRFDVEQAGQAVLEASWWVTTDEGTLVARDQALISEPFPPDGGAPAMAAALSRALGRLAGEIARPIAARETPPAPVPAEPRPRAAPAPARPPA